jgi:hypothetical protein
MPLTMRPSGLASPIDKERQDLKIYSGTWAVGRIYEERSGPEHMRWFWSLYGMFGRPQAIRGDGRAPTLEEAKTQFQEAWQQWLTSAKLREEP